MLQPMQNIGTIHSGEKRDVVVIGGALSGASTALLLKRKDPTLRILLIEKNTEFKRRVGEATVEVSGYFLCRILGLTRFLTQTQLCKNGLRFWFSNHESHDLGSCSEVGGKYLSTVPSFLVDRSVLDEEVLSRAKAEGVEILRPASVKSVELVAGGEQLLHLDTESGPRDLQARWVVDASGVRALLARDHGWWRQNEDHPTLSAWSRWRGVKDWDDEKIAKKYPQMASGYVGIRGTATNHFMGDGWWAWWISLKGGETSIGIVLDQRKASWPQEGGSLEEKIRNFLSEHTAAHEMMEGAECVEGDVNFRRNLPYSSTLFSGDGFVLVGDAHAFLDPFYSPGMDWVAFSSLAAVKLIMAWRRGEDHKSMSDGMNQRFASCYERMYEALYQNKYDYIGDYDLMRLAFHLDISFYYFFVARHLFRGGEEGFADLPFVASRAYPVFALMRCYNRRLAAMGRKRRELGSFGCHNAHQRDLFAGFNFNAIHLLKIISRALASWLLLECKEGWRSWGSR